MNGKSSRSFSNRSSQYSSNNSGHRNRNNNSKSKSKSSSNSNSYSNSNCNSRNKISNCKELKARPMKASWMRAKLLATLGVHAASRW